MKRDEYLDLDFKDLTAPIFPLDRRQFLKLFGGGIFIFFSVRDIKAIQEEGPQRRFGQRLPSDFNAFLRIGADGRVSCFTGKIEMGQGAITSLAQMLSDELDVPLDSVDMVMGDTDLCPWDMGTFGSMTTRFFGPPLREAAAEAKAVLIDLAADWLKTPKNQLIAKDGIIFDRSDNKKQVAYAQLTKGNRIERAPGGKVRLKTVSELTTAGKSALRLDAEVKVTGEAKFAGDIRLPGMMYAKILRPPAHGAVLKSLDSSVAKGSSGAQIVQDGDLIACLHENPDEAEKTLAKIKVQFTLPEAKPDDITIFNHLLEMSPEGEIVVSGGNLKEGESLAVDIIEGKYMNSYVAHAPIETHTSLAKVEGNKATIWASTQNPFTLKEEAAQVLGFPSQNVHVITPFVGGGFGGKTQNTQAIQAARLSKLTGKPIQVAWNREDEFFYDTFRPAAVVKIRSGIDQNHRIVLWDYKVYFAGERGSLQFYDIPHHQTTSHGEWGGGATGAHPFRVGPWRAPANNTNTFARESQVDIMAAKAGVDPFEFRMKNLKDERMRRVLLAAGEKFGWTSAKIPSGRGFGIACGIDAGTYVGAMAEVAVDKKEGHIQVKRVVCAQDMGFVINPDGAKMQMEGCITMGLGYALSEEIHFRGGEIIDLNFDDYNIPRFSWLPEIETVLIENKSLSPQGGGEPAIVCMGAVVANAVYDAVGARVYQLPMIPERVKNAII